MKKSTKWGLGIIIFCAVLIIFISILPETEEQKAAKQQEKEKAVKQQESAQEVELNYGEHAIITHQQIIDTIKENVTRELESADYDYRLKEVAVKDKKISVYLDLHFVPPSKSWIINEGKSWLWYVATGGIEDDNHNLIGNIYSTGYDISVLMWTWYEDTGEVIPWGHAVIFNSGQPFTSHSLANEWRWIDGAGMKMLK